MEMMTTTTEQVLKELACPESAVCVALVGEEEICDLHERYFDDPTSTNVVSLEYPADSEPGALVGEVYVCWQQAVAEAESAGQDPLYRVCYLLIHGLLHIFGYEHVAVPMEEKQKMEQVEQRLENAILGPLFGRDAS